jgi:hypothetical protein
MDDKAKKDGRIEGEGSYSGTKAYDEATQEAKRALESKEAAELEAAEAKGRAGDPQMWEKNPSRPK